MDEMINQFPSQLKEALKIVENSDFSAIVAEKIKNILIVGMGGSGIGGDFAQAICRESSTIPIVVNKRYGIPGWVSKNTLVICNSYSGNTEETLNAYAMAMEKSAQLICVSSGGKIIENARKNKQAYVQVPGNYVSPRACLGYSLIAQLGVLDYLNLTPDGWRAQVQAAIERIQREKEDIHQRSEQIAMMVEGKRIVIYAEDTMEPLALRWRQQINENAKALCWHNVIPEMNHNELVGWRNEEDIAVLYLRSKFNASRNALRMDITKEITGTYAASTIELYGKGDSFIEQLFYLVHLGDWMSYELAILKNRNVVEVKVIDYLKSELAKY